MDGEITDAFTFTALNALGLHRQHLESLARQGTLQGEGAEKRYFKLRFRHQGRRIVRYVGTDAGFVERVRVELERLQRTVRKDRGVRRVVQTAKACLRQTKSCLAPALEELGYHFWGHEIRRRRIDQQGNSDRSNTSQVLNKGKRIMDDRNTPQAEFVVGRRPQDAPSKLSTMSARHQARIDDLARSALECTDPRQAVLRFAMAKSFGMGALVSDKVEHMLRVGPMTIREFRKQAVPLISVAANLFKQGTQCAQIDREYDQMNDREDEGPLLLPPGETEN